MKTREDVSLARIDPSTENAMQRVKLLGMVTCFCLVGLMQGCIIVDGDDDTGSVEPGNNSCCSEVRVCETRCDEFGCYDDCTTETRCPDSCDQTCHGDFDCPSETVCIDDVCQKRNFDNTGTGGLCQSCGSAYDCAEPDSRCVRLFFERTPDGGPKVCATDCNSEADCPFGFECVDRPGTPRVCVPDEEWGSTDRVCPHDDLPSDIECFSSENCSKAESCVNNECVAPQGECTRDSECGQGAKCRNFECVDESKPQCVSRTDCQSGEICVDGKCEARDSDGGSCVKNDECRGDAVCVDGDCLAKCQDRSDCNSSTEICRQGLCVAIECRFNSDCGGEEVCVDAQCKPACSKNADCSTGYICSEVGDYCTRDPNVECRSDAECLSGESCHNGTCAAVCNCNQQCADGQICNKDASSADNTGLCESPNQTPAEPECENDCQCPSGQSCTNGTCTTG